MTGRRGQHDELPVAGPAARHLDRLPDKVAAAIVTCLLGPLLVNPHRVGRPLHRELAGLRAARAVASAPWLSYPVDVLAARALLAAPA